MHWTFLWSGSDGLPSIAAIQAIFSCCSSKPQVIPSILWTFHHSSEDRDCCLWARFTPASRIHPVFHVFQLKLKLGSSSLVLPKLPPVDPHGILRPEPVEVLARRARPRNNQPFILLIRSEGQSKDDATWEPYYRLKDTFPHLVGKVF